jgi:hypothetical protein
MGRSYPEKLWIRIVLFAWIYGATRKGLVEDRSADKKRTRRFMPGPYDFSGAGNGIRTRDFNLGKVALYH